MYMVTPGSRSVLLLLVVLVLCHAALPRVLASETNASRSLSHEEVESLFEEWMHKYNILYEGEERAKRLAIFEQNLNYIIQQNAKNRDYKLDVNRFSTMTFEEFKEKFLGANPPQLSPGNLHVSAAGRKRKFRRGLQLVQRP